MNPINFDSLSLGAFIDLTDETLLQKFPDTAMDYWSLEVNNEAELDITTWPIVFDLDTAVRTSVQKIMGKTSARILPSSDESLWTPTFLTGLFGTLVLDNNVETGDNLGDQTQIFAGNQFLPYINTFVDREYMDRPQKPFSNAAIVPEGKSVTLFLNAWYGRSSQHWPPGPNLDPLMFSIHFSMRGLAVRDEALEFYKNYGPIGARDTGMLDVLQSHDVTSYFSACGTLLHRNPFPTWLPREDTILVVDVDKNALKKVLPEYLQKSKRVVHFRQSIHVNRNDPKRLERFHKSFAMIMKLARAKLVITSRIHSALPSVGLDTPVIFVNSAHLVGGGGHRAQGLLFLFHTVSVAENGTVVGLDNFDFENPSPNPANHHRDRLRASFWNVIRRKPHLRDSGHLFGMVPFPMFNDPTLPPPRTFHIIHSSESPYDIRQRRTIESILHNHPNANIILYGSNEKDLSSVDPLSEAGYHVTKSLLPTLSDFLSTTKGISSTVIRNAFQKAQGQVKLMALLLLYRDGGVYLDSDMILLQPLNQTMSNVVVEKDQDHISGSVLIFEKHNPILEKCIKAYANGADGTLENVLTQTISDSSRPIHTQYGRMGLTRLSSATFFPTMAQDAEEVYFEQDSTAQGTKANEIKATLKDPMTLGVKLFYDEKPYDGTLTKKGTIARDLYKDYCVLCSDVL